MKFLLGVLLVAIAESGLTTPLVHRHCKTNCSEDHIPVCGKDKTNELTTFTNICWYNLEKCQNPESRWNLINVNGECVYEKVEDSDPECKEDYLNCNTVTFNPICGRNQNGITQEFKNMCLFKSNQCVEKRSENWKILKSGSCPNSITPSRKYHCPTTCTEEFEPVCGRLPDTTDIRIFNNRCYYDRILCENSKWEILDDQECKNFMSNNEKQPICGISNGKKKNFTNLVKFLLKKTNDPRGNWTILSHGKCKQSSSTKCPNRCGKVFRPICAIDNEGNQNQFPNECSLTYSKCMDPSKDWTILKRGTCSNERLRRDMRLPLSCFGVCSFQYAPFCAMSSAGQMRTFTNECEHEFEVCNNRDCMWKKLHDGNCDELLSSNYI